MNKYVEEYIAKRKVEIEKEKKVERMKLLAKLHIGEKEYLKDFPGENWENFPEYDDTTFNHFRYNAGEITDEEYKELQKYAPQKSTEPEATKRMSGWYVFSIIMMILGCLGGLIIGLSEENAIIAIVSILGVLIFFSQIILLCKIEYNTRSNS